MEKILTADLMSASDKYTIEKGMPSLVLMERAALSVKEVIMDNDLDISEVLILCGTGNNAADGIALARLLCNEESQVTVCMLGDSEKYTEELKTQLTIAQNYEIRFVSSFKPGDYTLIVDAMLGIGCRRDVTGAFASAIDQINECDAAVIAVDIPSGLSSDTGLIMGTAVLADITVTFQYAKRGQLICDGPAVCGELYVEDIGIMGNLAEDRCDTFMLTAEDLQFLPPRDEAGNKGTFGKLLVIAGSKNICGAAYLSAAAAFKCGVGMVKIFTAAENRTALSVLLPEALISTYEGGSSDLDKLEKELEWADAVVIGPGLGTDGFSRKLLKRFLKINTLPCVMDADALNIISSDPGLWELLHSENCIITPHPGEMSRLTGLSVSEIKSGPVKAAEELAASHRITCVLKDARTVTAYPGGFVLINTSGSSALATAGSGDVLSGMIGGFITRYRSCGLPLAAMAVYVHGIAGETNAEQIGEDAVTAGSLLEYIKIN